MNRRNLLKTLIGLPAVVPTLLQAKLAVPAPAAPAPAPLARSHRGLIILVGALRLDTLDFDENAAREVASILTYNRPGCLVTHVLKSDYLIETACRPGVKELWVVYGPTSESLVLNGFNDATLSVQGWDGTGWNLLLSKNRFGPQMVPLRLPTYPQHNHRRLDLETASICEV